MRAAAPLLAIVLSLALAACAKPTVEECERLCRAYSELAFFEKVEASLEGLAPDQAERLRAEKKAEWQAMQEDEAYLKKLDNCMTGCRQGVKRQAVACVEAAETVAEADACIKN